MDNDEFFEAEAELEAEANASSPLLGAAKSKSQTHNHNEDEGELEWPGQDDFKHLPAWKRPSIWWLLPPQLLFTLAFGGIVVPKLNLIKELVCRDHFADQMALDPSFHYSPIQFGVGNDQCRIPAVQSKATQFMLIAGVLGGCLSAISSPKLGALSDRYGRLRILTITTMGGLVGELITIVAASTPETFPIQWLYLGFVIDGLCGSFTAGMAVSYAYAADCTPPSRRNVAFGYFHGVLFTGIAIGPLIAALVVKATGTLLSIFYFALACHLIFLFCVIVVIPESVTKARQQSAREKYDLHQQSLLDVTAAPVHGFAHSSGLRAVLQRIFHVRGARRLNIFEPLKILYPTGPGSSAALRRNLIVLSAVDTIMFGVAMGSMTVVIYYTDFQFKWATPEQSLFMSMVNICRVVCLIGILPLVTRLVRGPIKTRQKQVQNGCDNLDLYLIRTATFFDTLGYLGYTLVRTGPLFILSGCIASVGGIGSPTLQSALTKHVPHEKVGQLLGANGLLHALARVVSPVIFNLIYSKTVGKYTQAVFLSLSIAFSSSFILSWWIRKSVYLHEPGAGTHNDEHQAEER